MKKALTGISWKSRYGLSVIAPRCDGGYSGRRHDAGRSAGKWVDVALLPNRSRTRRHRKTPPGGTSMAGIDGETQDDDKISNQLLTVERDAFREWLTTPPTTLAGVIATLDHASRRPYPHDPDYPDDYVHTNLIETAEYLPGDVLEAGEQFPAMVAAALRKIGRETALRNCYNVLAHNLVLTSKKHGTGANGLDAPCARYVSAKHE